MKSWFSRGRHILADGLFFGSIAVLRGRLLDSVICALIDTSFWPFPMTLLCHRYYSCLSPGLFTYVSNSVSSWGHLPALPEVQFLSLKNQDS